MCTKQKSAFADRKMLGRAIKDSFAKLSPKTQAKNPVMFASLLVIGKTSFRSSIIQDAGSSAQRLSEKIIQVHAAAVVPVPLQRSAAHPHFA